MLSRITPNQNKLGVYIHWPFCVSKCPYCDFNSHVKKDIDVKQWEFAYLSELRWMADIYKKNKQYPSLLHTVFFGGGTPSLMPASIIERILETIEELFILHPKIEITVEANPSSSELNTLSAFKSIGVNRISFGAQSLNPKSDDRAPAPYASKNECFRDLHGHPMDLPCGARDLGGCNLRAARKLRSTVAPVERTEPTTYLSYLGSGPIFSPVCLSIQSSLCENPA